MEEQGFIDNLVKWLKDSVSELKMTTAQSYAHDLVCKAEITSINMLKYTLANEKEAVKIDFIINSFHMLQIKSALGLNKVG